MKVYLAGGEKSSYRNILLANNAKHIAFNYTQFPVPKRKELSLPALFQNASLLVYQGENDENVDEYEAFLRQFSDDIEVVILNPGSNFPWLGAKAVPLWNDGDDPERLAYLCQSYNQVAVSDKAITAKNQGRIRTIQQRWNTRLFLFSSKPDVIESLPWEAAIVTSWTSAVRYGETQVWDGHGLRRYPAQQKQSARQKHRADIARLGIDIDAVMDDDANEVGKLAVRSWMAWEGGNFSAYDPSDDPDDDESEVPQRGKVIDISIRTVPELQADSEGTSIGINVPQKRHEDERVLLPVMGIESMTSFVPVQGPDQDEEPRQVVEEVHVLRYSGDPLRQCDSCYLASRCPAFKEHTECAYRLPVEIRTKDQLQAALRAMVEMQVSRVLFARFAEEIEGQGLNPEVSKELDRVFALVEKFKDISDTRDVVRFEMEARGSSGVLSRIFGSRAGNQAKALPDGGLSEAGANRLYREYLDVGEE